MRYVVLLLLLLGACASPNESARDARVLTSALRHFLGSHGADTWPPSYTVIVQPLSGAPKSSLRAERLEKDFLSQGLEAPTDAFSDFVRRNAEALPVPALGDVGALVRYDASYTLAIETAVERETFIPYIFSLDRPGYARDGRTAIVTFGFSEGLHGGSGLYVLVRSASGDWYVNAYKTQNSM